MSKFADHLPLYRQDGIFEREGVDIPSATQTSWVLQTYEAIRPLGDELKRAVLQTDVLFTGDSIIPLQVKGNGRLKKARLWVYVRGGSDPSPVVHDFSHDRGKSESLDTTISVALSVFGQFFMSKTFLARKLEKLLESQITEANLYANFRY